MLNYYCSFRETPLVAEKLWQKARDLGSIGLASGQAPRITPEWLVFSYIPDRAEPVKYAVEMISLLDVSDGIKDKEMRRLKAAASAIHPLLMECRSELLKLESLNKSSADAEFTAASYYKFTWLKLRCTDAFKAIIDKPIEKMSAAALAFKPATLATFVNELDVSGYALKLIEESDLTSEICVRAIAQTAGALYLVPGYLRTRELCLMAMKTKAPGSHALEHVPIALRDEEMCDAAVRNDGLNLQHVPIELRTVERCAVACCQTGLARACVPVESRQVEIDFCVAQHGMHEKHAGQIWEDLHQSDPVRADAMYDKYAALFNEMHHPTCTQSELADMGLAMTAS